MFNTLEAPFLNDIEYRLPFEKIQATVSKTLYQQQQERQRV